MDYQYNSTTLKVKPDTIKEELDPLTLELEDDDLVRAIDRRVQASDKFYNGSDIQLKVRRKKNKEFLIGKQGDPTKIKKYQVAYIDNLIYEAENTIKPIAMSRLPDLTVKPAKDTQESKDLARDLTKLVNSDIRKRENRRVLAVAWRHLPVYYLGVIKAFWDSNKGKYGDYGFKFVHPEKIVLDHTAPTAEDVDFVDEYVELSIQEVVMRFPKKKDEIYKACSVTQSNLDEKLASIITIHEVWFKWWEKNTDKQAVEDKNKSEMPDLQGWKEVNAVCWKYKHLILEKMKNPYWDWEGTTELQTGDGMPVAPEMMTQALTGEISTDTAQVFNNFFTRPQFPYIFLTYEQWG